VNPALATVTTGSAPRLRKRELFLRLGYEPHPGQVLVHRSRAPRRVLACGVRWGKSTCAAYEAVSALLEPRESSRGWIVAPTYGLTRAIYELARAVVYQHFAHRILEDDDREYRLVIQNLAGGESVMEAKSADNSVSLLGEGLDWLILDEAARVRRNVWEQHLSQRLIDRRGWALLLSTPRGTGWFHEAFRRGQKGRDSGFESWRSPSWTNPHLDAELIEAERTRLSREAFEQEFEARFLGEGLVEHCELCGGPSDTIVPVLVLRGDEEAPRCPDCTGLVDREGRTAVTRGIGGPLPTKIRRMVNEPGEITVAAAVLGGQQPELN
jgi:hypothetical protein